MALTLSRQVCAGVLALSFFACSHAKLARRDVVNVAKAPVREWKTTAAVSAAVAATVLIDDEVAEIGARNDAAVLDAIEPFGGGHSDKVIAGFLLYGVARDDDRAKHVAFDAFVSSMIASKGITPALKRVVHRDRPNGAEDSFPSNHATQAFAVATVIARHYEHRPWVRRVAYAIAAGVGLARIANDDHWLSDVVAGAAIGTFVGHTVVSTRVEMTPIVERDRIGILLRVQRP